MKTLYFNQQRNWTLEEMYTACEVSKKAVNIIHGMKALLTTQELRQQFMARVPIYPTPMQVNDLLHQFRCEQLDSNPMSDDDFKDLFLLNPLKALTQYFKEQVSPVCVKRMQEWGVTTDKLIEQRSRNKYVHIIRALNKASL
ncbi:hypothetical protein ACX12E_16950 [Paenibacillus vandeheii]